MRSSPANSISSASRHSGDVDRWVSQISAELQADDDEPAAPQRMPTHRWEALNSDSHTCEATEQIEVTLEFGRTRLTDGDASLVSGSVLKLDQQSHEPIDVLVAGRLIARGELLVVEGKLGVRIVERFESQH